MHAHRNTSISVRNARKEDLPALAAMELLVWGGIGAPPLTYAELSGWLEEKSPFFLIAYDEGAPCGYYYGKTIMFSREDAHIFSDPAMRTGSGYCTHAHVPGGNTVYGMNVVSMRRGAGHILTQEVNRIATMLGLRYLVGFSRLPGFDAYAAAIERSCNALPCSMDDIAVWYVQESARLCESPFSPTAFNNESAMLPELVAPDPVLSFHVRGTPFEVISVVPEYIVPDPQSRNYGAMILSDLSRL